MTKFIATALLPFVFCFCKNQQESKLPTQTGAQPKIEQNDLPEKWQTDPTGETIKTRFPPPSGFERISPPPNSFGGYLQNLPLKPAETEVYLFNGSRKGRQDVHAAVVDLDVGKRDLQQCADAVMRLRAEYLYGQKQYSDIHFNFVNGFLADYSTWRKGNRIKVNGNSVSWRSTESESKSYSSFRQYLNMVFSYAGTLSLAKEMSSVELAEMEIGDVFILGGSPGHAVIVVDMAAHPSTGEKCFLLAQSYMPAQDIHILKNPRGKVWYPLDFEGQLETPEWTFSEEDLKRFLEN